MRATEMHDLLAKARAALQSVEPLWLPGRMPGFTHINYCRYCHYSQGHGHGDACVLRQLENLEDPNSHCYGRQTGAPQK